MEYTFNAHGVCTNATRILEKETKEYDVILTVAQAPNGKWTYGYVLHIKFGNHAYSGAGASMNRAKYDTMEEAKAEVIEWYLDTLKKDLAEARAWNARQLDYDRQQKPRSKQLNLF